MTHFTRTQLLLHDEGACCTCRRGGRGESVICVRGDPQTLITVTMTGSELDERRPASLDQCVCVHAVQQPIKPHAAAARSLLCDVCNNHIAGLVITLVTSNAQPDQ
jgi:hypothetical protein